MIVDVYKGGKGRGVMLQGTGKLAVGKEFQHAKIVVEQSTGWKLDRWEVGLARKDRVDTMILFKPTKIIEIG